LDLFQETVTELLSQLHLKQSQVEEALADIESDSESAQQLLSEQESLEAEEKVRTDQALLSST